MLNNGSLRVRQNPPSSQPFSPLQHWPCRKPPLAEVTTLRQELQNTVLAALVTRVSHGRSGMERSESPAQMLCCPWVFILPHKSLPTFLIITWNPIHSVLPSTLLQVFPATATPVLIYEIDFYNLVSVNNVPESHRVWGNRGKRHHLLSFV